MKKLKNIFYFLDTDEGAPILMLIVIFGALGAIFAGAMIEKRTLAKLKS